MPTIIDKGDTKPHLQVSHQPNSYQKLHEGQALTSFYFFYLIKVDAWLRQYCTKMCMIYRVNLLFLWNFSFWEIVLVYIVLLNLWTLPSLALKLGNLIGSNWPQVVWYCWSWHTHFCAYLWNLILLCGYWTQSILLWS